MVIHNAQGISSYPQDVGNVQVKLWRAPLNPQLFLATESDLIYLQLTSPMNKIDDSLNVNVRLNALSNRPVDRLSITWKRNGVKLKSGISVFGRRLMILNPTSSDIGKYECVAMLQSSSVLPVHAHAYISIIGNNIVFNLPRAQVHLQILKGGQLLKLFGHFINMLYDVD